MVINKYIYILFFFILQTVGFEAKAEVWTADNIELVHLHDRTRYISDPDGIMSAEARRNADIILDSLRRGCKVQVAFVIVRRVKNGDTFRMAQDLGNKYGVGDIKTRRGLVVVIATEDKKYTIAPGKGLEGELTDVDCSRLANAFIIPNMKIGKPDYAVLQISQGILAKLRTGELSLPEDTEGEEPTAEDWMMIVFIVLVIFSVPMAYLVEWVLLSYGIIKKSWFNKKKNNNRKNNHDDNIPPFMFFGGGGGFGGGNGSVGGNYGGGSFGGGGSSGGW